LAALTIAALLLLVVVKSTTVPWTIVKSNRLFKQKVAKVLRVVVVVIVEEVEEVVEIIMKINSKWKQGWYDRRWPNDTTGAIVALRSKC
jgi:hypothetical protein